MVRRAAREIVERASDSGARRAHLHGILERSVPITPAFGNQVQRVVDRRQKIQPPFFDIGSHVWVSAVEVSQGAAIAGENRDGRVLISFLIFRTQVIFEVLSSAALSRRRLSQPCLRACLRSAGGSAAATMAKSTFCAR